MRFGRGSKLVRGAFIMAIGRTTLGEKQAAEGLSGRMAGKTRAGKSADAKTGEDESLDFAQNTASASAAMRVAPGLHFVSTPIGAARDITLRALDVLGAADVLAAEDTRTLRHLMEIHGIPLRGRPLVAYHEHNAAAAHPRLLAALQEGKSVAYASEAGTPLVSDPGFGLAREAIAQGFAVLAAPGASAVLCALAVSGLPSDRFLFAGFAPATRSARVKFLTELKNTKATLILYESPKRVKGLLADAVQCFGEMREAAVCRELTKKFEEVTRGTLGELALAFAARDLKGEIVVLVGRGEGEVASPESVERALQEAMKTLSVKDAAAAVASSFGLARRDVYQMALTMDRS
jgi:16S rRNA (cytidine1402-2'-O)-methyltransferase